MKNIKEIHYERVHNLGNYETERGGVIVTIDDYDDPKEAYQYAKEFVEKQLGINY